MTKYFTVLLLAVLITFSATPAAALSPLPWYGETSGPLAAVCIVAGGIVTAVLIILHKNKKNLS